VGKTYISDRLAKVLRMSVIRKDDIFDSLVNYIEDIPTRHEASINVLNELIDTNINNGSDMIIDCPLHNNERLLRLIDAYELRGAILKPILVICTDNRLWAERFNMRKINPLPNQIITDFHDMMKHYDRRAIVTEAIDNELVIDGSKDCESVIQLIEAYIKNS